MYRYLKQNWKTSITKISHGTNWLADSVFCFICVFLSPVRFIYKCPKRKYSGRCVLVCVRYFVVYVRLFGDFFFIGRRMTTWCAAVLCGIAVWCRLLPARTYISAESCVFGRALQMPRVYFFFLLFDDLVVWKKLFMVSH